MCALLPEMLGRLPDLCTFNYALTYVIGEKYELKKCVNR